jgi:hypothetical protein
VDEKEVMRKRIDVTANSDLTAGDERRRRDAAGTAQRAGGEGRPERGRAVVLRDRPARDQRLAERQVGEDRRDADEQERHRRQPEVARHEQAGEDDADDDPRHLDDGDRRDLPADTAHDLLPQGRRRLGPDLDLDALLVHAVYKLSVWKRLRRIASKSSRRASPAPATS